MSRNQTRLSVWKIKTVCALLIERQVLEYLPSFATGSMSGFCEGGATNGGMDATNNHIHSRRAANGITMFSGAVMVGFLISTFLLALPSTTFALGRDGD